MAGDIWQYRGTFGDTGVRSAIGGTFGDTAGRLAIWGDVWRYRRTFGGRRMRQSPASKHQTTIPLELALVVCARLESENDSVPIPNLE